MRESHDTLRTVKGFLTYFLFVMCLPADEMPSLPRPDQVDKTENLSFIVAGKSTLPGIVVDNTEAKLVGNLQHSVYTPPFVGEGYIHDMK